VAFSQLPPWPFITIGQGSSVVTAPVNPLSPWAKPALPNAWDGFPHVWDSNVHSTSSVGIDYTLKVTPLVTWYVHTDNDLRISTTTLEADP
jgi:hypothetical protein